MSAITKDDLGLELEEPTSPALRELLRKLFGLLREHYAALNYDDLKKYSVPRAKTVAPVDYTAPHRIPLYIQKLQASKPPPFGHAPHSNSSTHATATSNNDATNQSRVLDTHGLVLDALDAAAMAAYYTRVHDKTQDQFVGLRELIEELPIGTSLFASKRRVESECEDIATKKRRVMAENEESVTED